MDRLLDLSFKNVFVLVPWLQGAGQTTSANVAVFGSGMAEQKTLSGS